MPCRYGTHPAERLRIEFVEAEVEIAFRLVDLAEKQDVADSARVLFDAEDVFRDIGIRLKALAVETSDCFAPLVAELRRAIDLAQLHAGNR